MHWRRKWQPLQCSCLENPRDREAWWAAVYGVAQSRTQLKRLSSSSNMIESSWLHCHRSSCLPPAPPSSPRNFQERFLGFIHKPWTSPCARVICGLQTLMLPKGSGSALESCRSGTDGSYLSYLATLTTILPAWSITSSSSPLVQACPPRLGSPWSRQSNCSKSHPTPSLLPSKPSTGFLPHSEKDLCPSLPGWLCSNPWPPCSLDTPGTPSPQTFIAAVPSPGISPPLLPSRPSPSLYLKHQPSLSPFPALLFFIALAPLNPWYSSLFVYHVYLATRW